MVRRAAQYAGRGTVTAVALVLVALILGWSGMTAGGFGERPSFSALPPEPVRSSTTMARGAAGGPVASLEVLTPNTAAGALTNFELNVSPVDCRYPAQNLTIAFFTFTMGDGFQFSVPGLSNESSCVNPPWFEVVEFGYAYAASGTYHASVLVTSTVGESWASNVVTVHITNGLTPSATQFLNWLYGVTAAALVALAVLLILRRRIPPAPSLPPVEV